MKKVQNIYDNSQFYGEYSKMRESNLNANELIEIPTIKKMLPDLKDKRILDIGCGAGGMSRFFSKHGAKYVLGIDISKNMINQAKSQYSKNIEYKIMQMEELDTLNQKFDLIFSSLAFHYVKNFKKLIKDCSNLLSPNGILLFSQEHPIATAPILFEDTKHIDIGGKRYYLVSDYNSNTKRVVTWNDKKVIKYHRNFSTVINTLLEENLVIKEIREAKPTKRAINLVPKYVYQNDRPYFLFVKAQKDKE